MPSREHCSQSGFLALQTYRPCNISQWRALGMIFSGITCVNAFSTESGVLHVRGTSPILLLTLKTWVSTAIFALPKATAWMTFAVFRPTPGSCSSSSLNSGTFPPKLFTNIFAISDKCFACGMRFCSYSQRLYGGTSGQAERKEIVRSSDGSLLCGGSHPHVQLDAE